MIGSRLPFLTLLVFLPAMGSLAILALPARRASWLRSLALGFALLPLAFALAPGSRELRTWAPGLGLSYDLGISTSFTRVLSVWIPVLAGIAFLSAGPADLTKRTAALVLLAETSLLGLLVAGDAALALAFYGSGVLAASLLLERSSAVKTFFFFQSLALALALALVLVAYHLSSVQTGFPSADIARWSSLVLYPEGRSRLFLLGSAALALASPLFPFTSWLAPATEALSGPGRLLVLGGWTLAGTYLFDRVALASFASGNAKGLAIAAALGTLYAGIAPYRGRPERTFIPLLVGFQGLSVLGLLSPSPAGVAAGRSGMMHLALALAALLLWSSSEGSRTASLAALPSRLARLALLAMVFLPTWWTVLREEWRVSPGLAGVAGVGLALMAIRLARTLPPLASPRRLVLLAPIAAFWLFLVASPERFSPGDARSSLTAGEEEEE